MLHWKISLAEEKAEVILYHIFRISWLFLFLNKK